MNLEMHGHYFMHACHLTDAAEVVLYRCIQRKENDKGQDVALEMSFEYLDDFEDPPGGGIHGFYNSLFGATRNNGTLGLNTLPEAVWVNNTMIPKRFDRNNHVLHWMVSGTSLLSTDYVHT